MRRLIALAALFLAAPLAPAVAQTAEERAQLDWVLERGRLLYVLDRAAWVGTDDLLARMPDPASLGLAGYIVEEAGEGYAVTFYGGPRDRPVALYVARVEDGRVVDREIFPAEARPALSAPQRRLMAARDAARRLDRRPCVEAAFNTVIVPPEAPDTPIDVYLLTPQLRDREWPVGGHFRATVGADGEVASSRAFTNTCLAMTAPPQAVSMVVNHLLDPLPTEIHVFTSLASGFPLYVGVSGRAWEVTGRQIRLVGPISD